MPSWTTSSIFCLLMTRRYVMRWLRCKSAEKLGFMRLSRPFRFPTCVLFCLLLLF